MAKTKQQKQQLQTRTHIPPAIPAQYLSNFASVFEYGRERMTIAKWMQAWRIAESPIAPRSYPLMEAYDMTLIDAEVITAVNNRKNKVLGEPYLVLNPAGEYEESASKLLKGSWFDDFVGAVLDSEFFGSSLIELSPELNEDYTLKETRVVERRNVIPSRNLVLPYPFSAYNEGINFTAEHYRRWYIFVQSKRFPLGLLLYATPYAILSRDALVGHADFNRDYGRPYKIVKTDKEGEERQQVLDALLNVEEELNGVFDTDEDIQIAFPAGASGSIDTYDRMDEKVSKKLLKIIQGHIKLSNDTEGGGLNTYMNKDSIAKTPSEEVKEYDMGRVESIVNEELFPRLLDFNYPFEGHSFIFLDTYLRDLQRQKKRISEKALELALQHFEVEAKEFEELTGIKVKKKTMLPGSAKAAMSSNQSLTPKRNEGEKATANANANSNDADTDTDTETGNQVDTTQNLGIVEGTHSVEYTQNRDFFEYGAITLPIQNKELWASILPPINPNDLYISPQESIYGYEDMPHITALYGIHSDKVSTDQVRKVIQKEGRDLKGITVWLGQVSFFENSEKNAAYEVLKFEVVSPELIQFYYHLKTNLPYTKTHPKYSPHATIAYLKKGTGAKYVHTGKGSKRPPSRSRSLTKLLINQAQYSDGKGNKTLISFAKTDSKEKN